MEQTFTMAAAGERRSAGRAAADTRAMPTTLTSRTRCHSASSLSSTVPTAAIPALLTTMSRRPCLASTASDGLVDLGPVGDVASDVVLVGGVLDVKDRHRRTSRAQLPGDGGTDAGATAGDHRDQAGELAGNPGHGAASNRCRAVPSPLIQSSTTSPARR